MGEDAIRDDGRDARDARLTVAAAAERLGITKEAVRKRISRGTLRQATEGKKERLYVFLHSDQDKFPEPFRERYVKSLEDRVKTLEDEVYRQQAIILSMSQSMQALTGASEPRESPETTEEQQGRGEPHSATVESQESVQRPWWRRIFNA